MIPSLMLMIFALTANDTQAAPSLKVSESGRHLVHEDGSPFFYLGDTAWELFHRLDRDEAGLYLSNRAATGFTVIQAVVLAELDGLNVPNPYGHTPLKDNDLTQPDEDYFKHVDDIVNQAGELGMFIGMLPTWGDKWNRKWGVGPEIFTPDNAAEYGDFLAKRYRDKPIIWILGGDRNPETDEHLEIIRSMANAIHDVHGGGQLMTFHPQGGGNSAQWFHEDDWLDFNMFQSGHSARDLPNYRTTFANYQRTPVKPTLDGEPRYEDHPVNWRPENGWLDAFDVRQAAWWSMLAGACGHTYGDHNIWQMWQPGRTPISSARTPWREALEHPGSSHMGHLRRFFESHPWQMLVPDQSVLIGETLDGADHLRAARAKDGSFLLAYTPTGRAVTVRLDALDGAAVKASWFDPRTGETQDIGRYPAEGEEEFEAPSNGRGRDWLLVIEDAAGE
ncbi:MAG TPA: glycoside hydrolase family 140 protein [Methylomirabilota bacterium]|nr:glycoside hydrolase family 140 protein [Methylomirabilota bacterium]